MWNKQQEVHFLALTYLGAQARRIHRCAASAVAQGTMRLVLCCGCLEIPNYYLRICDL